MERISIGKARKLYTMGRTVYGMPSRIDKSHETFFRLFLDKSQTAFDSRIDWYQKHYCNEKNGYVVYFYIDPAVVLLKTSGNKYFLSDPEGNKVSPVLTNKRIIQYANGNLFQVKNGGFLSEPLHRLLRY